MSTVPDRVWFGSVVVVMCAALLSSCSSGSDSEPDEAPPLQCEIEEYPCDYASSDPDAVQTSADYLDEMAQRWQSGESIESLVRWLVDQPDVVDVWSSRAGFRFRVDGSAPMQFIDGAWSGPLDDSGVEGVDTSSQTLKQAVVAAHRESESEKRALVLAPIESERDSDSESGERWLDGEWMNSLQDARDYPEEVRYVEGEAANVEQFETFEDFDVVVVNAHGTTLCEAPGDCDRDDDDWFSCRTPIDNEVPNASSVGPTVNGQECVTTLLTGENLSGCGPATVSSLPPGVECAFYGDKRKDLLEDQTEEGKSCFRKQGDHRAFVTLDFMRNKYGGALKDKWFFFASCQVMATTVLRDAIGKDNAFFGWTDAVLSSRSREVTKAVLDRAFDRGARSAEVVEFVEESIGPLRHEFEYRDPWSEKLLDEHPGTDIRDFCSEDGGTTRLDVRKKTFSPDFYHHAPDPDTRVREIVQVLPRGDVIPAGIYRDGSVMDAKTIEDETLIDIDIYIENRAEFEGDPDFELQGLDATLETFRPTQLSEERDSWLIPATIRIPRLLESPVETTLRMEHALSTGGLTRHTAEVTIAPLSACHWELNFLGKRLLGGDIGPVVTTDSITTLILGQTRDSDRQEGGSLGIEGSFNSVSAPVNFSIADGADVWVTHDNMATISLTEFSPNEIRGELSGRLFEIREEETTHSFSGEIRWTDSVDCSSDNVVGF